MYTFVYHSLLYALGMLIFQNLISSVQEHRAYGCETNVTFLVDQIGMHLYSRTSYDIL